MTKNNSAPAARPRKAPSAGAQEAAAGAGAGNYFAVNGLRLYYEVHGAGPPLVLLHGGWTTIGITFGAILPALAISRRVIAVEQQGHGHTADLNRPLSFPQMADDTAALLRHLDVAQADFFGHSDGGNVGLGIALRHPELVRKLVVAGTNYNNDGLVPGLLESFKSVGPDDADMKRLKDAYLQVAPKPEDWPTLVSKVTQQALAFPGWPLDELAAIKAPVLTMIGDADVVCLEHAVALFHLIPHSQLAVLPGTDHRLPKQRAEWLLLMLTDFLDAPTTPAT